MEPANQIAEGQHAPITSTMLGSKMRTKKEVSRGIVSRQKIWTFLCISMDAYLPHVDTVNVFFLRE